MANRFGEHVRHLRQLARLSQEQLAESLGVGQQTVSRWENGTATPRRATLPLLANLLGVSPAALLDDLGYLSGDQPADQAWASTLSEIPEQQLWELADDLWHEITRRYRPQPKG